MFACLILAPHILVEGILTGPWMLACVISLRANRKARTKPMCLWGCDYPSRHFQCLALNLSYINLGYLSGEYGGGGSSAVAI